MPHIIPPTKGQQRWRALGYLFIALIGVWLLAGLPPSSPGTRSYIQGTIAAIWAVFMVTALPTAVSVLRGGYRLEMVFIPFFGSALGIAVLNVFVRAVNGEPELATRGFIAAACLCFLIVRGLQLHQITRSDIWASTTPR